jgi:hypothetical protein
MTSFFRFAKKREIYLDGNISLAHVQCTHKFKPVDKSQNTSVFTGNDKYVQKLVTCIASRVLLLSIILA